MSTIVPGVSYETICTHLANTNKTACLTVGSGKAADCVWVEVTDIIVVDSTGSVATAAVLVWNDGTEHVLAPASYGLPTATEPLEFYGAPIHLDIGGTVSVTGASGHHVHITFIKGIKHGASAQDAQQGSGRQK